MTHGSSREPVSESRSTHPTGRTSYVCSSAISAAPFAQATDYRLPPANGQSERFPPAPTLMKRNLLFTLGLEDRKQPI